MPTRSGAVLRQLRSAGFYPPLDAPVLNQQGGPVTNGFPVLFTSPAGATVYFTLQGTDPRLPGGAVSSSAQIYNPAVGITQNATEGSAGPPPIITRHTILKCRAKSGTQWSALNEAFFQVGSSALDPGEVAITELDFNPTGDDDTEFVELANLASRAVNLRGTRFTEGINYAFPDNRDTLLAPGRRLVLVKDLFHFQQRYGLDIPVTGTFGGNLSNGGERLTFNAASGEVVATFKYDVAAPWPPSADGGGYTLVLAHPQLGLHNPTAWRISGSTNATPGASEATQFTGEPLADLDQDGLPALLEYALGTNDTDSFSGPGSITANFDAETGLTLTFPRNLVGDDVSLRAEFSTDLVSWTPANLKATRSVGDGTAMETWGVVQSDQPVLFLRVRVTRP